jgi:hypothetical protein
VLPLGVLKKSDYSGWMRFSLFRCDFLAIFVEMWCFFAFFTFLVFLSFWILGSLFLASLGWVFIFLLVVGFWGFYWCFYGVGLSLFCFWSISVAPVRGGTYFLCRRKESKQRKRASNR